MENNIFILEFIILGLVSFILDIKTNDCIIYKKYNTPLIYFNLYFHHIINIFLNFGWISDNPIVLKIYLVTPIIVLLHWKTNEGKCALTQHVNKICRNPDDEYLHDFLYLMGIKDSKYYTLIQSLILFGGMLIAVRKLLK
jgi:hypothetical protein